MTPPWSIPLWPGQGQETGTQQLLPLCHPPTRLLPPTTTASHRTSMSWASSKSSAMVSPARMRSVTLLLDSSGGSFSQRLGQEGRRAVRGPRQPPRGSAASAPHQPLHPARPTHLSKMLLMWEGGQMVRSRDHDWSALQCRGPCWLRAALPSPALGGLKMPSKQDRHETRSCRGEICLSDHSCQKDTTVRGDPSYLGAPGAPRAEETPPPGTAHLQGGLLPQLSLTVPVERAWAVTHVPMPLPQLSSTLTWCAGTTG